VFVIFGWGYQKAHYYGPTYENQCTHCNKKAPWELRVVSVWFTVFSQPWFPYRKKYFLVCPICNQGVKLGKPEFDRLKHVAINNLLRDPHSFACPGCGMPIRVGTSRCEACDYQPRYACPNCRASLTANQKCCPNCGKAMHWGTS
jgi:predicted RNA-binding Zn-ribbon protein involved in translation (DUF1610 family)